MKQDAIYWQNKIIHFLHDPPGKPFFFFPRSGGHKKLAKKLFDNAFKHFKNASYLYADCLTSGVDRPVLKLRGTIYYHNNQLITHPLSSSHIKISLPDDLEKRTIDDIKELESLQITSVENLRKAIFQDDDQEDYKTLFISLWRFLRETLAQDSTIWHYIPADTRIPDHSIWDHCRLTSALSFVKKGLNKTYSDDPEHPWLFSFVLKSPHSFLVEARKSQDLWIGSMIIADLTFAAMQKIAEYYGPDVIIYPDLMGNPRADLWLQDYLQNIPENYKKFLYECTRAAVVPHTFVAILPRGHDNKDRGSYSLIKSIGDKVVQAVHERWRCYTSLVEEWMRQTADINNSDKIWNKIWQYYQERCPLEPTWMAIPWLPCEKQHKYYFPGRIFPCQDIVKPDNHDMMIINKRYVNSGLWMPEPLWARMEYIRSVFARAKENYYLKSGFNYSLLHYKLKQQHKVRNYYIELPPDPSPVTGHCTLCKKRIALRSESYSSQVKNIEEERNQLREFWSNKEFDPENKGRERLCPVCATKRFLLEAIRDDDNQLKPEIKRLWMIYDNYEKKFNKQTFPSTPYIACQKYLLSFIENYRDFEKEIHDVLARLEDIKWIQQTCRTNIISSLPHIDRAVNNAFLKDFLQYNPEITIYPEALFGFYQLNKDKIDEAQFNALYSAVQSLRKIADQKIGFSPGTQIAILCMDGDKMGELLLGSDERIKSTWENVLHPELVKKMKDNATEITPGWKEILKLPRTTNAAIHALISRILKEFAHRIVPWVVEQEYSGRVIYAGGDDLLAIVPADEALDVVSRLNDVFTADWVVDTDPAIQSWNWFNNDWQNSFDPSERFELKNGYEITVDDNTYFFPMFGKSGSISAGIAFGHYKTSLGDLIATAKTLLEELAKDRANRSACGVGHFSRSGMKSNFVFKWAGSLYSLKNIDKIKAIAEAFKNDTLAMGLPYKLRTFLMKLGNLKAIENSGEKRQIIHGLVAKEISEKRTEKNQVELNQAITDIIYEGFKHGLDEPVNGLFFCRYLASRCMEKSYE